MSTRLDPNAGLCPHCENTGSLEKQLEGYLNCAHCDVAMIRHQLAEQLDRVAPEPGRTRDWAAFQLGRLAESGRMLKEQAQG